MHYAALEPRVAFWSRALRYAPNEADRSEDWCRLDDPNGCVNLSLQVAPDPSSGTNKLHLDLYTADQRDEVDRLKGLGATVTREPGPGDDFVVMAHPKGNLFCLVDRSRVQEPDNRAVATITMNGKWRSHPARGSFGMISTQAHVSS